MLRIVDAILSMPYQFMYGQIAYKNSGIGKNDVFRISLGQKALPAVKTSKVCTFFCGHVERVQHFVAEYWWPERRIGFEITIIFVIFFLSFFYSKKLHIQ